ncbi:MAG TPA: helix-turn-helix transcriptional regulator [Anaerolineales bacterium]|nr:helix-turn-helix transcriptional regulator [Anaerolineales bacterium]
MNQPDLGLKISELRQQKGLTQERLAEYCEVSTRTIQRIEAGEVEPRSFTRNSLSNILEFDLGREHTSNEHLWLTLLHLRSAVCLVFIPLLL